MIDDVGCRKTTNSRTESQPVTALGGAKRRAIIRSRVKMEEDEQIRQATEASLASHRDQVHRQSEELAHSLQDFEGVDQATIEASFQIQASEELARSIQKEEDEDQVVLAIQQSYGSDQKRKLNEHMNTIATEYIVDRSEGKRFGCWDCPSCTLVNSPYANQCSTCQAKPPIHVLVFNPLPSIRFGLEIEIVIPFGKRDGFTLQSVAKNLTLLGPEKVEFLGYTHETTRFWKIISDSSIRGSDQDLCFELVSPVLQGDAGLAQLRSVMDNVRRIGISTNASCGFHVHVDAEGGSPLSNLEALKSVSRCFVSVENAFDALVTHDGSTDNNVSNRRTNRNRYCQSNRIAFGQMSNRQRWNKISSANNTGHLVRLMNPDNDRYRKLNLTNLTKRDRPSTCEFRHHGGVQDLQEAEAWVRLVLRFCENAAKKKNTPVCLLPEGSPVKDEVRALFDLVECHGLEQMFSIDRKLFLEERMKNVWRCKVCKRPFNDSRSLSQHCSAVGHRMY
jgi:hypothetical protein